MPVRPEPPRDQYERYLLAGPDGEVYGHQRVTTFAGKVGEKWAVTQWQKRHLARGMILRPGFAAQYAAMRDPVDAEKKRANKLIDEAEKASGIEEKANLGTAMHEFTERVDMGENPQIPDLYRPDVEAYQQKLADYGMRVLPDWVERVVAVDDFDLGGTLDRVVEFRNRLYILDVKSGASTPSYPHEPSVQLSCYANASTAYDENNNWARVPMIEVDKDLAIMAHLPVGSGTCSFHWVDIRRGWRFANVIHDQVIPWLDKTKPKDLCRPIPKPLDEQCEGCGVDLFDAVVLQLSMAAVGQKLCGPCYEETK